MKAFLNDGTSCPSIDSDSEDSDEDVQQVEMLLEYYFLQLDNTLNRLQTLCEYIDDTEDYINIEQDKNRNQLLQVGAFWVVNNTAEIFRQLQML